MNFDNMPILHWDFAYHAVMAFMVAVALAMVYFFYRSGWFK
jgi:Mg2+ and Co2+ transporter CorA